MKTCMSRWIMLIAIAATAVGCAHHRSYNLPPAARLMEPGPGVGGPGPGVLAPPPPPVAGPAMMGVPVEMMGGPVGGFVAGSGMHAGCRLWPDGRPAADRCRSCSPSRKA